jgi:hypothetical protein
MPHPVHNFTTKLPKFSTNLLAVSPILLNTHNSSPLANITSYYSLVSCARAEYRNNFLIGQQTTAPEYQNCGFFMAVPQAGNHALALSEACLTLSNYDHALGGACLTLSNRAHALGEACLTLSNLAHALGEACLTLSNHDHALGGSCLTLSNRAHALDGAKTEGQQEQGQESPCSHSLCSCSPKVFILSVFKSLIPKNHEA